MERELDLQIPQWQLQQAVAVRDGMSGRLVRTDALGRAGSARFSVYPCRGREQARELCQTLDMAQMLIGCANIVCHRDHWARQTEDGWEVCVLEADLQSLEAFCASRSANAEELIVLPADPKQARHALAQYREKQRMPEEMILRIGCDICLALEKCREKGLEGCAVTMQTVCVTPGGDFVLTGLGTAPGDRPVGTVGLAQLLCGLLGGENGKCAFGDEKLRALVEKACAQEMDVKDLWTELDRIAHGEPEEQKQKEQIRQLQQLLTSRVQTAEEEKKALTEKQTLVERLQKQLQEQTERLKNLLQEDQSPREQNVIDAKADEKEHSDGSPWFFGGNLSRKEPAPALPLEKSKDYTLEIRQKMALSAVVSAGDEHSVALLNDGTAVASGKNVNQQCQVGNWRSLQAVSAGDGHTVGLTTEGRVVAVGNNGYGQCAVSGWQNIVQVCAGYFHTVGLKKDGTVVATGKKDNNRCEVSLWKNIISIAVGVDHTVGLHADGTVVATGSDKYGQCHVSTWKDIVQISAGAGHTVGLKSDGTVVAVGWDHNNKCAVSGWKDIVAVSAGVVHTVGLKRDGTVVATGNAGAGRCDVTGWRDVAAISAGKDHTLAVCVDGTVLTAGSNAMGQCGIGIHKNVCVPGVRLRPAGGSIGKGVGKDYSAAIRNRAERGRSISAGHAFSACLMEGGTVQCTGNQVNTRTWKAVEAVAAGADFCLGLRINGMVLAVGGNTYGQCNVEKWDNIIQVAAGEYHAVGLRSDGTVVATGNNANGQCAVYWKDIAAVAAGYRHTVGLRKDGTVVATGDNKKGQCAVSGWKDIVAICAGEDHTVGLKSDGTVVAAGSSAAGQCFVSGWKDIVSIDAGKDHTVGLKSDGTVVAAGRTSFNQCAVSRWKNIAAVSAGQCYTLGLRKDGSVVATGLNTNGQCRVTGWRRVKVPSA